jgi:hypothetical protein
MNPIEFARFAILADFIQQKVGMESSVAIHLCVPSKLLFVWIVTKRLMSLQLNQLNISVKTTQKIFTVSAHLAHGAC